MTKKIEILSERIILRELRVEDANLRYLDWLQDEDAQKYIDSAARTHSMDDLIAYIKERVGRADILFLGIFEKSSGLHIGNIKYEPVNTVLGYAIMGVLIGDSEFRGRGVTTEILRSSAEWLRTQRGINQVLLGVDEDNVAAIRAYEKVGFVISATEFIPNPMPGSITMVWKL